MAGKLHRLGLWQFPSTFIRIYFSSARSITLHSATGITAHRCVQTAYLCTWQLYRQLWHTSRCRIILLKPLWGRNRTKVFAGNLHWGFPLVHFPWNQPFLRAGGVTIHVEMTSFGLDGPGIGSRWGARFSAPVQNGPEAHPASYKMGSGSFPGVKWQGRGVDHTPPQPASRLMTE